MTPFGLSFASERPSTPGAPSATPAATPVPGGAPAAAPGPGAAAPGAEQKSEVGSVMVEMLPWGVSILFHAGIVLLSFFAVWTTVAQTKDDEDNTPIIPIAKLGEKPGGSLSFGSPTGSKSIASPTGGGGRRSLTASPNATPDMVAGGSSSGRIGGGNKLIGLIGSAGGGDSSHGVGKANPFGSATGIGVGEGPFRSSFGGTGGNARRIAYVIDASGSLTDSLPFVINELKRSIGELSDLQRFTVVFFQDGQVIEVPPGADLRIATAEFKKHVQDWVDPRAGNVVPQGKTTPMKAIVKALSYKPQLMFILSDNITGRGQYEIDQKTLIAEINKANTGGTKINTIQFLYPDPLAKLDRAKESTLQKIASMTGGLYKYIDARELGFD